VKDIFQTVVVSKLWLSSLVLSDGVGKSLSAFFIRSYDQFYQGVFFNVIFFGDLSRLLLSRPLLQPTLHLCEISTNTGILHKPLQRQFITIPS
jgi:hypothetical protein